MSDERLFAWHAALFPTGRSGIRRIIGGAWRKDAHGPMQIISGPVGKEKVHYEAPAAALLEEEMSTFLAWANDREDQTDMVLRAALGHLWFVTIHPFDDGNGRIARAIADWTLARSEASPQRFYSMSAQIRHERNDYYSILEKTQKGTLDVTSSTGTGNTPGAVVTRVPLVRDPSVARSGTLRALPARPRVPLSSYCT